MPKFSIVIPAYNRHRFLLESLASCQMQTVLDFEVVVSDDCSTEDLARVVEMFNDQRFRYSASSENLGAVANHQRAVSLASGSYVLILHSDDLILPDCLERAGQILDQNAAAAAVYFSQTYWNGNEVSGCHPIPDFASGRVGTTEKDPWLEKFHGINPSCCLFRKAAFDEIGGFRNELQLSYDYDLFMRLMDSAGGVTFLAEILCIYRQHEEQSIQTRSIDGLKDVLKMWSYPEYSHWPAAEIVDIAVQEARSRMKSGDSPWPVLSAVRQSGSQWRFLSGLPRMIVNKITNHRSPLQRDLTRNCKLPDNAELRIREASALIQRINEFQLPDMHNTSVR
jgi:glycosyltransferase involved in cell wall biosynthesis